MLFSSDNNFIYMFENLPDSLRCKAGIVFFPPAAKGIRGLVFQSVWFNSKPAGGGGENKERRRINKKGGGGGGREEGRVKKKVKLI